MKNLNKEQILFILSLVILGYLSYARMDDQYKSRGVRKSGKEMELVQLPPCAEIQFINYDLEFFSPKGRNIYAPPRDWLPLEPLVLDAPPQVDLLPVAPYSRPGLGERFFAAYHFMPEPPAPPEEGEEEGLGLEEEGLEGEEVTEAAPGTTEGVLIDLMDEGEEEDPEAALLKAYDWIQLRDQVSKIFGNIKNEDKYTLAKNNDPIRFEMVSITSGKIMAPHDYTRDRVSDFGFADTVMNRIELMIQDINFNAGSVPLIQEKARWCLSLAEEDPVAMDYAAQLLEQAIELDPLAKVSYSLLVDVHLLRFDRESALKVVKSAIQRRLIAPGVYVRYGRLLRHYGMENAAMDAFLQAEQIKPAYAEALMERAELTFQWGDYEEALRLFQEALRSPSWKNELKMQVILGESRCLLALNRLTEALNKVHRAINLDEEEGEAWNLRGAIALAGENLEGAEEAFLKAVELSPGLSNYLVNLGVTLFRKGDLRGAMERLDEAINMDPYNSCYPTAARGFISQSILEEESASSDYENAVEIDPTNFYALYLLGRNLMAQGDTESAVETLKKALRLNCRMSDLLSDLGRACLLAGKAEDAAFYFQEFLKASQGDYRLHYLFGLTLLQLNRVDEAVDRFEKAIAMSDRTPDPFNGLGFARYAQGRVNESLDAFGEVLRAFEEEDPDPRYQYAKKWMTRIERHRRKSQWLDGFQRKDIKNNWTPHQRCGPTISIINNELVFKGIQRQEQPDERTDLRRVVSGREFRVFEVDLTQGSENQAVTGVFVGLYISRGGMGMSTKAEVAFAIEPNGTLRYNVIDKANTTVEWEEIPHDRIEPGTTVRLGMELVDYEKGLFRIYLDGEPVLDSPLNIKDFRKNSRDLILGTYTTAPGSRKVDMKADNVRIVVMH